MPTINNKENNYGLQTKLQPHQQRVVDRIMRADQPGLVVAHGLGSGKSFSSIASTQALGMDTTVVLPAALQDNYAKERSKHLTPGSKQHVDIESMQGVARRGYSTPNKMMIVDEAHRLRNPGNKALTAIRNSGAEKRLLLTASPFYNNPAEIAPLVNVAAGTKVLPEEQSKFMERYTRSRRVNPGLIASVFSGAKPGVVQEVNPRHEKELKGILNKWVDYHANSTDGFPTVQREDVKVQMGKHQQDVYDTAMGRAPAWLRYKIKAGMPPSKTESKDMNSFLSGVRQISNSTRGYDIKHSPEESKIDTAFERLSGRMAKDPGHKAIVYSNYLNSGISPYREKLTKAGIPFGEYTGEIKKKDRDQLVRDYNSGKKKVILMTSAAGEGLDLKGTGSAQILEPHFNLEKIRQVEGRAIRYGSHASMPKDKRNVLVENFIATRRPGMLARLGLINPAKGVDEYLGMMSKNKEELNSKFRDILEQNK